jgi:hypothetical protein
VSSQRASGRRKVLITLMVTGVALAYPSPALDTTDDTAERTQAASLPKSDGTYVVQMSD